MYTGIYEQHKPEGELNELFFMRGGTPDALSSGDSRSRLMAWFLSVYDARKYAVIRATWLLCQQPDVSDVCELDVKTSQPKFNFDVCAYLEQLVSENKLVRINNSSNSELERYALK
ncbi:hypothetical protein HN587_03575 [Candidatus Woesearchaeota archaeon]|nr:hypothetical protein [Candidatus Woesearchaeota archaeon]